MLNIHTLPYNLFQEKTMIVNLKAERCVIIDPGFSDASEKADFFRQLSDRGLGPEAVLLTHAHIDHICGVKAVQDRFDIPIYMNADDKVMFGYVSEMGSRLGFPAPDCSFRTTDIYDGSIIEAAGIKFEVITTPGHTPGGVCYLDREDKALFCGDTLFAGAIGRTDLKYGDYDAEIKSVMEKLILLDPDIRIFPGHGPDSTIRRERSENPFLEPFNETEPDPDEEVQPISIRRG